MSLALNPAVSKNRKTDNLRSNKISYKFDPRRLSKKLDEHEKIFSKKSKDYTEILNKQNKDYIQVQKELTELNSDGNETRGSDGEDLLKEVQKSKEKIILDIPSLT